MLTIEPNYTADETPDSEANLFFTENQSTVKPETDSETTIPGPVKVGLWDWDIVQNKVHYYSGLKNLLGFTEEDISENFSEWENLIHPEDIEQAKTKLFGYLSHPYENYTNEFRLRHKDGSYRNVVTNASLTLDENGTPIRMIGSYVDITEHIEEQKQLAEQETLFSKIFQSSPIGINIFRASDRRSFLVNEAFLASIECPREKVIGHTIGELIRFVDQEKYKGWLSELKNGRDVNNQLISFCTNSGKLKHVLVSLCIVTISGEMMILVILTDITENIRNSEESQKSNTILKAALESMSEAVFITDYQGKLVDYNDSFVVFNRFKDKSDCLENQTRFAEFLEISNLDGERIPFEMWPGSRATQGEVGSNVEYRLKRKDIGEEWFGSFNFSPIRDSSGKINGAVVVGRDITEQKKMALALHENEARFSAMFYNNQTSMMLIDPQDGRIIDANQAAGDLYDWPVYRLKEMTLADLDMQKRDMVFEIMHLALNNQKRLFESQHRLPNGEIRDLELYISPIMQLGKQLLFFIIHDITSRKQAETRIHHLNRLYATASQINQTIVRSKDETSLFRDVCNLAVQSGGYRMAWIGLFDPVDGQIKPTVFAGQEQGFLANKVINLEEEINRNGPMAIAILEKHCAIFNDISVEAGRIPRCEEAVQRGFLSSACVPFFKGNEAKGVLTVYADEPYSFSAEDEELLNEIGKDISFALETFSLDEQRVQTETALQESEDLYRNLLKEAPLTIAVLSMGKFVLFNNQGAKMFGAATPEQMIGIPIEKIIPPSKQDVMRKRTDELISGNKNVFPVEETFLKLDGTPVEVEVAASLINYKGEKAIQVIIANISDRKKMESRIEEQLHRFSSLQAIDVAITSSLDLSVALDFLVTQVINQLEVSAACVLLLDEKTQKLIPTAEKGFAFPIDTSLEIAVGEDYIGKAALQKKTNFISDLEEAGSLAQKCVNIHDEHFVSSFAVPLIAKGEVNGIMVLFNRSKLDPDPDWINFMETLAGQAAIGIDNARMFEEAQKANADLVAAYDDTIAGWSQAMDLRDKETEGHTQRVTDMTLKLAERMGISQQDQIQIKRGALLHDIGKLGIPDNILWKHGTLTEEEWEIMRKHPAFAYEMLQSVQYLRPAIDIPFCHHEKWDGSGYPRGLKGEEIPLAARLFSVVDVWDALRSDRPYRKGWSDEKIIEYLSEQSGKHFDPHVVEVFLQFLAEMPI